MKQRLGFLIALALVCAPQPAWAMRTQAHEAAESADYGRKFGGMLGRGLLNVTTSFVDLLVNLVNETKNGPPLVGTLVGVAKGAGCLTLRTLSGGVDLITFWVPGFNGFPVSDSYDNCVAVTGGGPAGMPEDLSGPPTYVPTDEPGAAQGLSPTPSPKPEKRRYTK